MTFFCRSCRGEGEKGSPRERLWDRLQGQDKQGVQGAYYVSRRHARGEAFVVFITKWNLSLTVRLCFFLPQSNPKADVALMQNLLRTPSTDSMCGVTLNVGDTYVLNGRIVSGKALISYCGLSIRWADTTSRQRKGLRQLYQQGCVCDVSAGLFCVIILNSFAQLMSKREYINMCENFREYHKMFYSIRQYFRILLLKMIIIIF